MDPRDTFRPNAATQTLGVGGACSEKMGFFGGPRTRADFFRTVFPVFLYLLHPNQTFSASYATWGVDSKSSISILGMKNKCECNKQKQ